MGEGSTGLVVKGGDSRSEGRGFKSQHCILYGHFSHLFVVDIVMFVGKVEYKRKKGKFCTLFSPTMRTPFDDTTH